MSESLDEEPKQRWWWNQETRAEHSCSALRRGTERSAVKTVIRLTERRREGGIDSIFAVDRRTQQAVTLHHQQPPRSAPLPVVLLSVSRLPPLHGGLSPWFYPGRFARNGMHRPVRSVIEFFGTGDPAMTHTHNETEKAFHPKQGRLSTVDCHRGATRAYLCPERNVPFDSFS